MINWLLTILRMLQTKNTSDTPEGDNSPEVTPAPETNEKFGILDDLVFLIFLVPTLGVFLPQFRDDIKAGFDILSNMPDWFAFVVVLGVVSVLGFRKQLTDILSNFTNFRKK